MKIGRLIKSNSSDIYSEECLFATSVQRYFVILIFNILIICQLTVHLLVIVQ